MIDLLSEYIDDYAQQIERLAKEVIKLELKYASLSSNSPPSKQDIKEIYIGDLKM